MSTKPEDTDMPPSDDPLPYQVGYKQPPHPSRFRKGQSGNPKGRPKGVNNFKTDLQTELGEFVRMTEGGQVRTLTKQQALIKRTMEKAFKGEMRAIEAIVKWQAAYLEEEPQGGEMERLPMKDQAILDRALAKLADATHHTQKGEGS